jgi:thiamine kinase-like enzyme
MRAVASGTVREQQALDEIVSQLAPQLGELESDVAPLEGGITNRNFRARLGGRDYVIRMPGKETGLLEIDRGAEQAANRKASELGIAPPVAAALDDPICIVTEFIVGKAMSSQDLRDGDVTARVAKALRHFHDSGVKLTSDFDSFRIVETYAETAKDRGVQIPPDYEESHARATEIEAALTGPEHDPVACHDDLLAANFIGDGDHIWIVDWEYAGMGNRYFDLANFAINNDLDDSQQEAFLEAYFGEPPGARRLASLRLMRFMSDFREAMWGVVQQGISKLDFDFVEYATKHFARLRETAADPAFEGALEEARGGQS